MAKNGTTHCNATMPTPQYGRGISTQMHVNQTTVISNRKKNAKNTISFHLRGRLSFLQCEVVCSYSHALCAKLPRLKLMITQWGSAKHGAAIGHTMQRQNWVLIASFLEFPIDLMFSISWPPLQILIWRVMFVMSQAPALQPFNSYETLL